MIYINKGQNSIAITSLEFNKSKNYIPDLFLGLRTLNADKPISVGIFLAETPIAFVLLFKKILEQPENFNEINIYYQENSTGLREALTNYGLPYRKIKDFPVGKPDEPNEQSEPGPQTNTKDYDE